MPNLVNPRLIGITPNYGIPQQEDGLLLESLDFTWTPNWYDQQDNMGRTCGKRLVDEQIDWSMSGALVLGDNITIKGGQTMALVNAVPDIWQSTPTATTNIVTSLKHSYGNTSAQKADVGGSIYAFAETSASV